MMNRRTALRHSACWMAAVLATPTLLLRHAQAAEPAPSGPFTLAPLPYAYDALEPFIDARTMELHHDKHQLAYVTNLNKALAGHPELAAKPVETLLADLAALPEGVRQAVRNQAGGVANHVFFWPCLKKNEDGKPGGDLAAAIEQKWGSFETFKAEWTKAALTLFGSGWVWLSGQGKELRIEQTPNQDTPLSQGRTPLLALDVWEHAYYLKYQNRRPDYVAAFFHVINWEVVAERHARAART